MHSIVAGVILAFYALLNLSTAFTCKRVMADNPGELERTIATSWCVGIAAIANLLPAPPNYPNAVRTPLVVVGLTVPAWFFYRAWLARRNAAQ